MNQGVPHQGPAPTYDATHTADVPLSTSQPEERNLNMDRPPQQQQTTSKFGAPPMGEPSVPSAHPDNQTAATHTSSVVSPDATGPSLGRSQSTVPAAAAGSGGGMRRQGSGSYDASTAFKTRESSMVQLLGIPPCLAPSSSRRLHSPASMARLAPLLWECSLEALISRRRKFRLQETVS